jgi:hypothetical protein
MEGSAGLSGGIPPAPPLTTVAQGTSAGGEHWTVKAGGTRQQCWTFMHIELPDGRTVGGGGLGGPALPAGRFQNCSFHTAETGIHYVVGRVDPVVARIRLEFAGSDLSEMDLDPVGGSAELGVSFIAAVLPRSAELVGISAWDAQGNRADQQGTAHYGTLLEEGQADHGSSDPAARQDSGWHPLNRGRGQR